MLTGRVVRYDEARGYGFITPDDGGEDVFVHANMLGADRLSIAPGMPVEFEATEAERGPKALRVRVLRSESEVSTPSNQAASDQVPPGQTVVGRSRATAADDEDGLCDVLSERAFSGEITEALLTLVPDLTTAQLVAIRREVLTLARHHGWIED